MQSPWPTIGICLSYVYLVKYLGPALMKDREPYNIRYLMAFYNFAMVLISVYIFLKLGFYGWFGKYNYKCQPVDYSNSIEAIGVSSFAFIQFYCSLSWLLFVILKHLVMF
jgi:elongation of very long chain fatty acids protein 7